MTRFARALPLIAAALLLGGAVPFDSWREQRFSLLSSNDWSQGRDAVRVTSDGTVSLLWTALPPADATARRASWSWAVQESVPATALDRRGGDDRNLSLYFIFMPEAVANRMRNAPIRRLLEVEEARVLMYVWGGNHRAGAVVPSPYLGARGRTIALRQAGTGAHRETVDLARDYQRAFGSAPTALVGLALSADSDDTGTEIMAELSALRLE